MYPEFERIDVRERELIEHENQCSKALTAAVGAGRSLAPEEASLSQAQQCFKEKLDFVRASLENEIIQDSQKTTIEFEQADASFQSWLIQNKNSLSVTDVPYAEEVVKPRFLDVVVWLLLGIEGIYAYWLMRSILGDDGWVNILQSAVVATILVLITLTLKKGAHFLPRILKPVCFVGFSIAAGFFIYYSAVVRHLPNNQQDLSSQTASLVQLKSDIAAQDRFDTGFNLSLILTLLFGSVSLAFSIRDPREEKDAKTVLAAFAPVRQKRAVLDRLKTHHSHFTKRLSQYLAISSTDLSAQVYNSYIAGVRSWRTRLFFSPAQITTRLNEMNYKLAKLRSVALGQLPNPTKPSDQEVQFATLPTPIPMNLIYHAASVETN